MRRYERAFDAVKQAAPETEETQETPVVYPDITSAQPPPLNPENVKRSMARAKVSRDKEKEKAEKRSETEAEKKPSK